VTHPARPSSLRRRLLLGTTLSLAAILAGAGVTLYALMRASLVNEFDEALVTEARALARLSEQDKGHVEVELDTGKLPPLGRPEQTQLFELWLDDSDHSTVARSPALGEAHLQRPDLPAAGEQARVEPVALPGGLRGRAVYLRFEPRDESPEPGEPRRTVTLAVARNTVRLDATLARLRGLLLAVSAAAVVAGAAVVTWVIGRGLRPLNELAGAIERVGVNDLSERIEPNGTPREAARVVQRLNELLSRLDGAITRERSFTADVAHELRTPLAGLSSLLEVCASRPREAEAYRDVVRRCMRVTGGMQSMVNNLLLLARADCDQLTPKSEPVELGPLLRECWEPFEPEAQRRGLGVEWDVPSATTVRGDAGLLRMLANNLLANAVAYTDAGGRVSVRAATDGRACKLTVANDAAGVTPADAARAFDRFWRGDAARTDAGVRCGLGLSLCRKLTDVLGGTIAATSDHRTFSVTVTLPAEQLAASEISFTPAHQLREPERD
jgi:two-component system heavy metal sensor histidine kinase CusS